MENMSEHLLDVSAGLFAERGFAGVSMRQIAGGAGITQAAIYHHYANKKELYLATVRHLHRGKISAVADISQSEAGAEEKLAHLVRWMLEIMASEAAFRHIFIRELLEGDEVRLQELSENVFAEAHQIMVPLMKELAPVLDGHLFAVSLMGLVIHHIEARKLTPFLPEGSAEKVQLPVLANHITALLLNGVRGS
jgi:TetR/AcrR family transcriptional regulator